MISWVVVVILVIIGIFAIKMNHLKHRVFILILIFVALFLYATIALVNTRNDFDLSTSKGIIHAVGIYRGWLANGYKNVKSLGANAIKMDWSSTNETLSENP